MMRIRLLSVTAALLLASAVAVGAQIQTPPSGDLQNSANRSLYGEIDVGGRFTDVSGDQARYQRYRDLRDSVYFDIPFFHRETDSWWMTVSVKNLGYRDQRYALTVARPGKIKFRFLFDQTPTFISADTATPYTPRPGSDGVYGNFDGTLSIPDEVQGRVQANPRQIRQEIEALAVGFPSRIRRDSLGFDLSVNLTDKWEATFKYLNTKKQGSIPWGASFGFNLPVEVPLPIDTRTNDIGAAVEWTNAQGMFRVGWNGSWFDQKVPSFIWDNPTRITDRTYSSAYSPGDGTSRGRTTEWPSNSMQYFNIAGAYRLPSRTSLNGTLSFGRAAQDEALLPYTINTAIAPLDTVSSLDRLTAEATASLGAATLNVSTQPWQHVDISARYRLARYDNKTPHFERLKYVRFDQVEEEGHGPEFHGYTRNYLDLEAAYSGLRHTTLRLGYGYSGASYTERLYFKSNESTLRASVDVLGNQYLSLRSLYEHSRRRGSGLHEEALEEAGEQPGMRHFDVGGRDRDRVMIVANLMATGDLGVNALVSWTKDTFVNPENPASDTFGLRDYDTRSYGIGFDYVPSGSVSVGASYNYDKYGGLSQSRNASPGAQFVDPNRNWQTSDDQKGHSFIAYADLLRFVQNTELRLSYNYSKYNGTYTYTTGSAYRPTPSAPGGVAQLPELTSRESRLSADLRYYLRRNVAVGFAYWYDDYRVEDFTLGPPGEAFVSGIARPPIRDDQPLDSAINGIVLNYFYRPYRAKTAWVRLTYLF